MKKITRNKVQRMRNLVTGNYGAQSQTQSGYRKYNKKQPEGEVWEEDGKKWTMKNGIKQNVSKLKKAREINKIPMTCPGCQGHMNHSRHKAMYLHYGHCSTCQTKIEIEMQNNGTYNEWLISNVRKNFDKWKDDKETAFEKWYSEIDAKRNITEAGIIEDWSSLDSKAKQSIVDRFENYIKEEEDKMNKLIEEQLK
tara:strand:- start:192 stop:779 length:588 start_codon:yes stop_codon:yes gene_type:complete